MRRLDAAVWAISVVVVFHLACSGGAKKTSPAPSSPAQPSPRKLFVTVRGPGSVVSEKHGISCPPACTTRIAEGTRIELQPLPKDGWELAEWFGGCLEHEGACSFTVDGPQKVTATFERKQDGAKWRAWNNGYGAKDVAVDSQGSVYVAGEFLSTVAFGTQSYTAQGRTLDALLVKYTSQGNYEWSIPYSNPGQDNVGSVAAGADRIAVARTLNPQFSGGRTTNCYTQVYDTTGAQLWSSQVGTAGVTQRPSVVIDAKGRVTVAAQSLDARGIAGSVSQFAPSGTKRWTTELPGVWVEDIAVSSRGQIVVVGGAERSTRLGGRELSIPQGTTALVIVELNARDGSIAWWRGHLGSKYARGTALALDSEGGLYVGMMLSGRVEIGATQLAAKGRVDGVVAKLANNASTVEWHHNYSAQGADEITDLAWDAHADSLIVAGWVFLFRPNDRDSTDTAFAYRYSRAGEILWSQRFSQSRIYGADVDASGSVLVAGGVSAAGAPSPVVKLWP